MSGSQMHAFAVNALKSCIADLYDAFALAFAFVNQMHLKYKVHIDLQINHRKKSKHSNCVDL